MKIKKFLNILSLSFIISLSSSALKAEEFDVQGTILKAQNNDKQGLYQLAYLKQLGEHGIEKNITEAIELYKRASALGHRSANHNLGLLYYKGIGVKKDYAEAAKWFEIGAERNLDDSKRMLLNMNKYELIQRNEKKLESLLIEFADKGKQDDIEQLADYYYYTKSDMTFAEKPTLLLAEKGVPQYQHRLGMIYYKGLDAKPDYKKTYQWFSKAAEANNLSGKIGLASLYLGGLGVQQNVEKAILWFNSAYEQDPVKTCEIHSLVISKLNDDIKQCELSSR